MNTPRIPRGLLLAACLAPSALLGQSFVTLAPGPDVYVTGTAETIRSSSYTLGFNMPWDTLQAWSAGGSELWTGSEIRPQLYDFLKVRGAFTDAIYRYPGGTASNYFDWSLSVGPISSRKEMPYYFGSSATLPPQFGLDEFLTFVEKAKGKAMLTINMLTVLNVSGSKATAVSIDGDTDRWAIAKSRARGLQEYCNAPVYTGTTHPEPNTDLAYDWNGDGIYQANRRKTNRNGIETPYNVTLWELGNELDTVGYGDSAITGYYEYPLVTKDAQGNTTSRDTSTRERYAARCLELLQLMKPKQPQATYIVHAVTNPDADADTKAVWRDWHNWVLDHTGGLPNALAYHPYYDGNEIPSVNALTNQLNADSPGYPIHLTEHGRWPADIYNPATLPATTAIEGAFSNGDFLIANSYKPWMASALNHCLSAFGPWALFSEVNSGGTLYLDNHNFNPRPLAYGLRLMHQAFTPQAQILKTTVKTPTDNADYATQYPQWWNGYDTRGVVFSHGSTYGAAVISRAKTKDYNLRLTLPNWTNGSWVVRQEGVGGAVQGDVSLDAPAWTRYFPVKVGELVASEGIVKLPKRSVTVSMALAPNHTVNGDFKESGGSLPAGWFSGTENEVTGTCTYQTADTSTLSASNRNVRIKKTNASTGGYMLIQPYKNDTTIINSDLGPTGAIATNLNDRFVLRALVRSSASSNGAKLKVQFWNSANAAAGNVFSTATANSGKWQLLELDFVPADVLQGAAFGRADLVLYNSSNTGSTDYSDYSAVTLQRIPNQLLNGRFVSDTDGNNVPDNWPRSIGTYTSNNTTLPVGTIQRMTSGTHYFERLTKTVSTGEVFIKQSNPVTSPNGLLDKRRGERWRLRATVRYSNLSTEGARLRMQFYKPGGYNGESPYLSFTGSSPDIANGKWHEVSLEIPARHVMGTDGFQLAEAVLLNGSTQAGSYIDVRSMSLEMVE